MQCCECGGGHKLGNGKGNSSGASGSALYRTTADCLDFDAKDSDGYGCNAYTDAVCGGNWDTENFTVTQHCCVCGGGWYPYENERGGSCVSLDSGVFDSYGESCSDYAGSLQKFCGRFDDIDFTSNLMVRRDSLVRP